MILRRYTSKIMADVKEIWRNSDAVCFDVDSTLCTTEMIDELAAFCGVGEVVARWTRKAMGEGIPYREALNIRLQIIKPSKKQMTDFQLKNKHVLTEGVSELVGKLIKVKDIHLVSGGFYSLIKPIADDLGINEANIHANKILFDSEGNYSGFDENQPTSASGGKKVVMENLKNKYGYKTLVMIGDGMTDLEAYPPADLFIGFGGNVIRENVRKQAPWYVTHFRELIDCLEDVNNQRT